MKAKYILKIIAICFILFSANVFNAQNNEQQIQLTEQQLKDLYNNPQMLQQYGISKQQLQQIAQQNGINLQNETFADADATPKQYNNLSNKTSNQLLRNGNKQFKANDYIEAEINYRKSLEKEPDRKEGLYNLGNALYAQQRFDEANEKFGDAVLNIKDEKLRADAFHNLGNSFLNSKKLDEAIEAYKSALKLNWQDEDARYNLAYANFLKKKQQKEDKNKDCNNPQQNEEQKEQEKKEEEKKKKEEKNEEQKDKKDKKEKNKEEKNKEEKDKEEKDKEEKDKNDKNNKDEKEKSEEEKKKEEQEKKKEEQQKQDKDKKDKQKKDEEKQNEANKDKPQNQEKQEQQVAQQGMSKQEAERLLEALKNEEKKVQAKLLKKARPAVKSRIEKDW